MSDRTDQIDDDEGLSDSPQTKGGGGLAERISDWSSPGAITIHQPTQCQTCTHFRPNRPGPTCDAFPGGIPFGILANRVDHRKPFKGDGGIRWEPKDDDTTFPEQDLKK